MYILWWVEFSILFSTLLCSAVFSAPQRSAMKCNEGEASSMQRWFESQVQQGRGRWAELIRIPAGRRKPPHHRWCCPQTSLLLIFFDPLVLLAFYHFHFFVHAVFVLLYFPQCLIRSRMTWKYSPLCKNKFKRQAFSCSGEKSSSSSCYSHIYICHMGDILKTAYSLFGMGNLL